MSWLWRRSDGRGGGIDFLFALEESSSRKRSREEENEEGSCVERLRQAQIQVEKLVLAATYVKMPLRKVQRGQNATAKNMRIQSA